MPIDVRIPQSWLAPRLVLGMKLRQDLALGQFGLMMKRNARWQNCSKGFAAE